MKLTHDMQLSALNQQRGMTLAEVIVATAVMALMITSLISYVQSAGALWQKSHSTISLTNDGNALLDYIEQELWQATSVSVPQIGDISSTTVYSKKVSDYQDAASFATLNFKLEFDNTTNKVAVSVNTDNLPTGWSVGNGGQYEVVEARHNYVICRNVIEFDVNRISNRLFDVTIKLSMPRPDEKTPREVEFRRLIVMH